MVVEKGYKQTDIGVIPVDWDCFSVRQLIDLLTDYDANGSFESVATNVNVYDFENFAWYVRSTDLENKSSLNQVKYVDEKSYKFLKKTSLNGGELLFLKRGDIGNVYLFEMRTERATLAPNLYLLKLNKTSLPKFLYYYFTSDSGQRQLKSKNASSTLGALYKDDVKSIIVSLPPLPEQTAIANALSDMDALIAQTEKLIEKKKAIKQGVMQELLKPKEGWVTKKFTDVVNYIHGKAHEQFIVDDGDFEVVNSKFISSNGNVKKYSNHSFLSARIGDVLTVLSDLPNGKALAKCFFVEANNKYAVNQRVCIWRSLGAYPKFLFYILNRHPFFLSLDDGVSQTHILNNHIEKFYLTIPDDVNEQKSIAETIWDIDKSILAFETKLQKLKLQKQGMMQALLTGKIRLV